MKKNILNYYAVAGSLLLIPAVAMQFTDEVQWEWLDFLLAGFLLFSVATGLYTIWNGRKTTRNRLLFTLLLLLIFVLIWAELAVGIFDSPSAGS